MTDDLRRRLLRSRLLAEAQLVGSKYGEALFDKTDGTWFLVPNFSIPPGWSQSNVAILIDVPPAYPHVAPVWFWTFKDLRTSEGRPISHFFLDRSSDQKYADKGWGHFCIHATDWKPSSGANLKAGHSLITYLDLISTVFRDRKSLST